MQLADDTFHYAGWFTLDVRLLATIVVFSAAVAALAVALRMQGRRWDEHVVAFAAVFLLAFLVSAALTNVVAAYPVLQIETVFSVP
ncbi:MAG: hypothetical protein EXR79_15270 [Myxococcales bacterium]|nr:hypothetical protein [Myxococcales bacterium]